MVSWEVNTYLALKQWDEKREKRQESVRRLIKSCVLAALINMSTPHETNNIELSLENRLEAAHKSSK